MRKTNPRFTGENFQRNLRLADEVTTVAREVGATPAQVAIAWLLAKGRALRRPSEEAALVPKGRSLAC